MTPTPPGILAERERKRKEEGGLMGSSTSYDFTTLSPTKQKNSHFPVPDHQPRQMDKGYRSDRFLDAKIAQ